ncbi:transposable element Tc1 transposase [Trichonephila clavipes]|uniref:Transposable element Tc1 transposase n=1 Tax=Trichonephila clavipes TaxID=2585209 RepID=A0A8X6V4L1_TRICX|nr:transposable element Tc1 transposase [Trichonephila clavipes]
MALIACKTPRNSELPDFEKGIVVGYHRNGRFLRNISSEINIPKSTVTFVIKKWKVSGDYRNVLSSARPTKLRYRDRQVLSKEIQPQTIAPHNSRSSDTITRDC